MSQPRPSLGYPHLDPELELELKPIQRLRTHLQRASIEGLNVDWLFEDMLRRGVSAWVLAIQAGALKPKEAFVLGLLQDLGLAHLALRVPDQAHFIEDMADLPSSRRVLLEKVRFGKNHAQAYRGAAQALGLPARWNDIIAAHHTPWRTMPSREDQRLLDLSRAADTLADLTQAEAATGTLETLTRCLKSMPSRKTLRPRSLFDQVREAMPDFARDLGWTIEEQPAWKELQTESGPSALFVSQSFDVLTQELVALDEQCAQVRVSLRHQLQEEGPERDPVTDVLSYLGLSRHLCGALDALVLDQTPFALIWVQGPDDQAFDEILSLLRSSDAMCWHDNGWLLYLANTGVSGCSVVRERILSELPGVQTLGWTVQAGQGLLPGVSGIVEQARTPGEAH